MDNDIIQIIKSESQNNLQKLLILIITKYRGVEIKFIKKYIQTFKTKDETKDGYTNEWVFENEENCKSAQEKYKKSNPTNKKFPNFVQTIFTIGSMEQFTKYGMNELKGNYTEIYKKKITNTFKYIFYKMKKGIFVEIYNNKINIFLPITNANYKNEWYKKLKTPKSYVPGTIIKNYKGIEKTKYEEHVDKMIKEQIPLPVIYAWENNPYYPVNKNMEQWYANNCILNTRLRKEVGNTGKDKWGGKAGLPDEGDKSIGLFLELLSITCLYKKIKDCCLFINSRDFPILKKDGKHPYDILYCQKGIKNTKCRIPKIVNPEELISIFSQSKTNKYLDKLLPTEDEIGEVLNVNAIPNCSSYRVTKNSLNNSIQWEDKYNKALFRGSLTGCGINENNKRIQLSLLSLKYPDEIDSKITKAINRVKKDPLSETLGISPPYIINSDGMLVYFKNLQEEKQMSNEEQKKYKYIIIVEGYVSAFRMARMLSWGSLIINIDTEWKMWFEEYYKDDKKLNFRYYEDVNENNIKTTHGLKIRLIKGVKDLKKYDKISENHLKNTLDWCEHNDNTCKIIAMNSVKFWNMYLNKNNILNYTAKMLNKIRDI
jgi:hypothetical protein